MKKLNILFLVYMIIGIVYFAGPAYFELYGIKAVVLASSGLVSLTLSTIGYSLNGGK